MRNLTTMIALAFVLVSCASPPAHVPTPISTRTPTPLPSAIPAPTLVPTPTLDPNKPSDATGEDPQTGEYTKTVQENGKDITYIWKLLQFGSDAQNGVNGHWFESRMAKGPIDLTGYGENSYHDWFGADVTINLNVYSVEGMHDLDQFGPIYHPDGQSDYLKNDLKSSTLASTILYDIFLNYYALLPVPPNPYYPDKYQKEWEKYNSKPGGQMSDADRARMTSDWQAFGVALKKGITIHVGDQLWNPNNGYEVYWIDEAMAEKDPSMYVSMQGGMTKNFYWKIMVNNGKLTVVLAPASWLKTQLAWPKAKSRERMYRTMLLFPLQAILNGEKPNNKDLYLVPYQQYSGAAGPDVSIRTSTKTIMITTSFIDFMPNP